MTRGEVAKACGLDPPIEYIKRTGRGFTTSMLCAAVVSASEGKRVFILAHTQRYASHLAHDAQRMARCCGVGGVFSAHPHDWNEEHGTRGLRDHAIHRDHYWPR